MKELRILIADESEFIRRRVRSLLTSHPHMNIVGESAAESDLIARVHESKPDIVLMDIATPHLGGLKVAKKILATDPIIKIIVLSMHDDEALIREALHTGVRGYLLKLDFSKEIVAAVRAVANGRRFLDGRVSEIVMRGYLDGTAGTIKMAVIPSRLTARELEIVRLLALGNGNKQVAASLGIRVRTVETHRANIMRKLNLHTLAELIHYAISAQIIQIHPTPSIDMPEREVAESR